jgi:tRNA pseudouridine38-40 synthase
MAEAAGVFLGRHDFSTFRAAGCQADSPLKTLDTVDVTGDGDDIRVTVRARSFLYRQVRNIVGTLRLVGEGKWTPGDVRTALTARDRSAGGPTAPAHGLYLLEVVY